MVHQQANSYVLISICHVRKHYSVCHCCINSSVPCFLGVNSSSTMFLVGTFCHCFCDCGSNQFHGTLEPQSRLHIQDQFGHLCRVFFPFFCRHFLCLCLQCLALSKSKTTEVLCMLGFPMSQSVSFNSNRECVLSAAKHTFSGHF